MVRTHIGLIFVVLFSFSAQAGLSSYCPPDDIIDGRYLVRFDSQGQAALQQKSSQSLPTSLQGRLNWIHQNVQVSTKPGNAPSISAADLASADLTRDEAEQLSQAPGVLTVEPDCRVHLTTLPNDPSFPSQWSRSIVNLEGAWDISRSSSDVIVAVSDTGVDYRHADLSANMWRNETEINGVSGVDDDHNGCIDDIYGCDFGDQDGDPSPGPLASATHGTHVAGIIGAVGNNGIGVSGAAWKVRILASKGFSNLSDSASSSDLIKSVYYAVNSGAKIVNCSWGIDRSPSAAETDAFRYALLNGVLPIVAAGNESKDAGLTSPASIPGVLAVGSVNSQSALSSFSNFGSIVGVYAPGGESTRSGGGFDEYIYSTLPGGGFGNLRGTSMATPLVSGIAALILSVNPNLSPESIVSVIKDSARKKTSWTLDGQLVQTPIIDAQQALTKALALNGTQVPKPCGETGSCSSVETPGSNPSNEVIRVSAPSNNTGGCSAMRSDQVTSTSYVGWVAQGWTGFIVSLVLALPVFLVSRMRE